MKKLPIILTVFISIFFCVNGIAALRSDTIPSGNKLGYDQYLKKSKDQKKLSTILGISGAVIASTGMVLAVSQFSDGFMKPGANRHDYGSTPDILGVGGIALILAAIPITLESRKNKKRSQLYLHPEVSGIKGITQNTIVSTGLRMGVRF